MSMAKKIFPTSSGMYIRETVAGSDLYTLASSGRVEKMAA